MALCPHMGALTWPENRQGESPRPPHRAILNRFAPKLSSGKPSKLDFCGGKPTKLTGGKPPKLRKCSIFSQIAHCPLLPGGKGRERENEREGEITKSRCFQKTPWGAPGGNAKGNPKGCFSCICLGCVYFWKTAHNLFYKFVIIRSSITCQEESHRPSGLRWFNE